jgi:hypothetical protein
MVFFLLFDLQIRSKLDLTLFNPIRRSGFTIGLHQTKKNMKLFLSEPLSRIFNDIEELGFVNGRLIQ